MDDEIWVAAPGYPRYEISNKGRVRHARTMRVRAEVLDNKGYPMLNLSTDTGVKRAAVHRLVCLAFNGPPTGDYSWVLHRDGNPANNRIENLYWGNNSENQKDAVRHGTHPMSRKTHCPRGHEYTEENTYHRRDGKTGRNCRACARENWGFSHTREEAGHG